MQESLEISLRHLYTTNGQMVNADFLIGEQLRMSEHPKYPAPGGVTWLSF